MKYAIVMHGGAGAMTEQDIRQLDPQHQDFFREIRDRTHRNLRSYCLEGGRMLREGRSALEVAQHCCALLEDDPILNAGKGSVRDQEGRFSLDASIMTSDRRWGAVAASRTLRNPIRMAGHLAETLPDGQLLVGPDADRYAEQINRAVVQDDPAAAQPPFRTVPQSYFDAPESRERDRIYEEITTSRYSTVGCCVRDLEGRLCAATSTGGLRNKIPGRVGDSALIGAGTYSDELGAVSCTGTGERFIRAVLAHDILSRVRHTGQSLDQAMASAVAELPEDSGGAIGIDRQGTIVMRYNSAGMARAAFRSCMAEPYCAIDRDEVTTIPEP